MRVADGQKISKRNWDGSKKMWKIAGPAIITLLAQYSIGFINVAVVGHLGEVELASVSIVQNLIGYFVYGLIVFAILIANNLS